MHKLTLSLALMALAISMAALMRTGVTRAVDAQAPQAGADTWRAERQFPPLVFNGRAWLDCSISSTQPGRQTLRTVSGQGFDFTTAMAPIKDGLVKLKGAGMHYQFTSYPTGVVPAHFTGLGDGAITEMKAEVEVDVRRFQQPAGPGTQIHFTAADMDQNAAYVEFTGVFVRKPDAKRFPFRVLFGSTPGGGGEVTPGGVGPSVPLRAKRVQLGTPLAAAAVTTALYEAEDAVKVLPPAP